jgi:hypothetical protein
VFHVFLNNLLLKERQKINFTLGEFFHKADGHHATKNLCVQLNQLEVAPLVHRFPSTNKPVLHKDTGKEIGWTTCRYLLLNGQSAQFGDFVLPLVADKQTAHQYFGREVDTIIISGKLKRDLNGKPFTVKQTEGTQESIGNSQERRSTRLLWNHHCHLKGHDPVHSERYPDLSSRQV